MNRFKISFRRIFCLPPIPTLIAALVGFGLLIYVAVADIQAPAICYASYILSAYALVVSITGIPHLSAVFRQVSRWIDSTPPMKRFQASHFGGLFLSDVRFRTGVSLYQGFVVNLLYIGIKLFSGIYYRSAWFIALAIYYAILAAVRLMLVRRVQVTDKRLELRRYRLCGILLFLMAIALAGIVSFIVYQNRHFDYPGVLIYLMAAYSFYMVITAAVNLVKFHRNGSSVMSAAKAVNFVAAMVSILSLETAMLTRFNGNAERFRAAMTGWTGGTMCLILMIMAVFMIVRSTILLKKVEA